VRATTALNYFYDVSLATLCGLRSGLYLSSLTKGSFSQTLAAVALDEEIPEPEDNTRPAYETIEKVSSTLWV
jgi:hypothetical protein